MPILDDILRRPQTTAEYIEDQRQSDVRCYVREIRDALPGRFSWLESLRDDGPQTVLELVRNLSDHWIEANDQRVERRARRRARWLVSNGFAESLDGIIDLRTELRISERGEWLLRCAEQSYWIDLTAASFLRKM